MPGTHPSFLARIPADTPFTFQTLDRDGMVLNASQTWHQVRPGEMRANCGGCHAHSQEPLLFEETAAADPDYQVWDLVGGTPLVSKDAQGDPSLQVVPQPVADVEFYRDIRPVLQWSCVSCHTQTNPTPPGNLALDDLELVGTVPGDYARLADDRDAQWGHPPVIGNGSWRQTNASRYVRMFQSRRSLLMWKLFGRRLDGWSNSDHPTESVPGDPGTLPAGADPNEADLDFIGDPMPPPSSGVPMLTEDEKITFARWIDLGCPIDTAHHNGNPGYGWFLDDLRPTVAVSRPRLGFNSDPVTMLRFGLADANSGVDLDTLSVTADFPVAGRAAGAELADLAQSVADGIWEMAITAPVTADAHLRVEVADHQGNITRVDRAFATVLWLIFADGFETGSMGEWSNAVP